MEENAELWSRPDERSQRITLISWFNDNKIEIPDIEEYTTEELRQLYIDYETTY